jgi:hypothetical protein
MVQTRHGQFPFQQQRLKQSDGKSLTFLQAIGQTEVSNWLQEFSLYCFTQMPADTVIELQTRLVGTPLICPQTLLNWTKRKADEIDARLRQQVQASASLAPVAISEQVNVYDPSAEEVHVLTDGVLVKAQNPIHKRACVPKRKRLRLYHQTWVLLFQSRSGRYRYLTGSTDGSVSLSQVAQAYLRQEWAGRSTPLPVVVISDGATQIRSDLLALFGVNVTIILDWYHLQKRVYEQLCKCAFNKTQREGWEDIVLAHLWHGRTDEALAFLKALTVRNEKAYAELLGYLQKHHSEIIDYERRKSIGKSVGSGRMEKAVDQVVSMRQKNKGMSWSKKGSHSLAQLTVAQLNDEWDELFSLPKAA